MLSWAEVVAHLLHVLLLLVPNGPELLSHLLSSEVIEVFLEEHLLLDRWLSLFHEGLVILSSDWVAGIEDWKLGDVVLGLLWIIVSVGNLDLLDVIIT